MKLRVVMVVVCAVLIGSPVRGFADPPPCPEDSVEPPINGALTVSGSTVTFPVDLAPCQTVAFDVTTTGNATYGAAVQFKLFNSEGTPQQVYTQSWSSYGSMHKAPLPDGPIYVAPYRGTRGIEGLVKHATLYATFYDFWGHQLAYTVIITKTRRPEYNLGGTSAANAPLVPLTDRLKGSVHTRELNGQWYKITLQAGEKIYLTGQFEGSPTHGGGLTIDLHNAAQQFIVNLVNGVAYGIQPFPGPPGAKSYTNPGPGSAEYYLKVKAFTWPVHDFQFDMQTQPLQLKLFLDADDPRDFDPNDPHDDSPTYIPCTSHSTGISRPVPTSADNSIQRVQLIAAYVGQGGRIVPSSGTANFSLSNTSAFNGIAMNAADPRGLDNGAHRPDFVLASTASNFTTDGTARVDLDCWDYGGFTTAAATSGADTTQPMRLPNDVNNNWLPDTGWHAGPDLVPDNFGACSTVQECDVDDIPAVSGNPSNGQIGDGLANFEEFRGFIVREEHRRTHPRQKDLFLSTNLTTGIYYAYPASPTATHRIWDELQIGGAQYEIGSRVINWAYQNDGFGGQIPGHYAQRAMRIVDAGYHPAAAGCAISIGAASCESSTAPQTTPNEISRLEIYLAKIAEVAGGLNYTASQQDNAIRFTVGHETGHGIHVCHRPDTSCENMAGSGPSLMDTGFLFAPEDWESRAQYNGDDKGQIRIHVNF